MTSICNVKLYDVLNVVTFENVFETPVRDPLNLFNDNDEQIILNSVSLIIYGHCSVNRYIVVCLRHLCAMRSILKYKLEYYGYGYFETKAFAFIHDYEHYRTYYIKFKEKMMHFFLLC